MLRPVRDSLEFVDHSYYQKHQSEDPKKLRADYHCNLSMYSTHGEKSQKRSPLEAGKKFLIRYGRRASISLGVYVLSFLPVVGRFVLPAASFYTFNKAVGPVPATLVFGAGVFLPRRYLVVFLQSYFSSRSLVRELVSVFSIIPVRSLGACIELHNNNVILRSSSNLPEGS